MNWIKSVAAFDDVVVEVPTERREIRMAALQARERDEALERAEGTDEALSRTVVLNKAVEWDVERDAAQEWAAGRGVALEHTGGLDRGAELIVARPRDTVQRTERQLDADKVGERAHRPDRVQEQVWGSSFIEKTRGH
jgi:hypothetical protein